MTTTTPITIHILHVPGVDPDRDRIVRRIETAPGVQACVHPDPRRRGVMWNWTRALVCALNTDPSEQPWAYVVSDDAEPATPADHSPSWVEELREASAHAPDTAPFLGLTHFGGFGRRALDAGAAYGVGDNLVWGGGIAYRREELAEFLRWATAVAQRLNYPHDDTLVTAYAMRTGQTTALAARAIFDQPVTTSLLGHNTPIRRPYATIADAPTPEQEWSAQTTHKVRRAPDAETRRIAEEDA